MIETGLRLVHVIAGLRVGGAELSLLRLAAQLRAHNIDSCIVSLGHANEPLVSKFEREGLEVRCCSIRENPVAGLLRAARVIREQRPDVVHGWMYHGNAVCVLAARLARVRAKLVWGVRHSLDDRRREKWLTRCLIAGGGLRVMAPDLVIFNSERGKRTHAFWEHPHRVIRNGVDTTKFSPPAAHRDPIGRGSTQHGEVTIGFIARYHPMKGVNVFLDAMAKLVRLVPRLKIVMIGGDMSVSNLELVRNIFDRGLEAAIDLKGARQALGHDYHSIDFVVSTSLYGEGTPNVILESMACAVPVVATDVGDTAVLLGGEAWLVPPGDRGALAAHCMRMIELGPDGRRQVGAALRVRAESAFSNEACVSAYARAYAELLSMRTVKRVECIGEVQA
jgi:glycosyltransferase involved in cell wall biosynthesis